MQERPEGVSSRSERENFVSFWNDYLTTGAKAAEDQLAAARKYDEALTQDAETWQRLNTERSVRPKEQLREVNAQLDALRAKYPRDTYRGMLFDVATDLFRRRRAVEKKLQEGPPEPSKRRHQKR